MAKKFVEHKTLNLTNVNNEVLDTWKEKDVFRKSVEEKEGCPEFIFFEGPPSANGHPGIHHVMGRTIKDTFLRYKTMKGFQVKRKAGWDTHGLPVELSVEKNLGITKEDIGKKISVDDYNDACRKNVMMYTDEWAQLTDKMGYWVDLDNPYITYDNKYMVQASIRGDWSAKFAKGNRLGVFPAISAGWKISEEDFMASTRGVLDNLKLRASYGILGNDAISDFLYLQGIALSSKPTTVINGVPTQSLSTSSVPNRDITWETTTTYNIGLDYGFFKNRPACRSLQLYCIVLQT